MNYYMAAVPLFNAKMEVEAYQLKCQDAETVFGLAYGHMQMDGVMRSPGIDILNDLGIEPFTGGKPIFVELNQFGLLTEAFKNCRIPPELMIYILSEDIPQEKSYVDKCRMLKASGSSIAIPADNFSLSHVAFLEIADYMMFHIDESDYMKKLTVLRLKYPQVTLVFSDVADLLDFKAHEKIANTLYTGSFYTQPITKGITTVSPLKANAMRLLKIVGDADFELEEASKIIQQDTALSISLLKFINSPAIGIRSKINSIKIAVALLGQRETKRWVTVAVSTYIAADRPNEITRLSLIRAKFAEELAPAFEMAIHAPSLFLMGLFSLLDVILEKPMHEAVKEISVNDGIRKALVSREGAFKDVLNLIYSYEQADWKNAHYIVLNYHIPVERVNKAFIDSLIWYKQLLESLE